MFEKKHEIKGINKGFYFNGTEIIAQSGRFIKRFKNLEKELEIFDLIEFNGSSFGLHKASDNLVIVDGNSCSLYNKNQLILRRTFENGIGDANLYFDDKLIVCTGYDYEKFLPIEGLFDLNKDSFLWESEKGEQIRIVKDRCFTVSKTKIKLRNYSNGDTIWSYKIKESELVPYIAGLTDKVVVIGNKGNDSIVIIDLATGNELMNKTSIVGGIFIHNNNIFQLMGGFLQFSQESKLIVKKSDYYESMGMFNQGDNFLIIKDYVLYSSDSKNFGAINIKSGEVEWLCNEKINIPVGYPMSFANDFLLILDFNNKLIIMKSC